MWCIPVQDSDTPISMAGLFWSTAEICLNTCPDTTSDVKSQKAIEPKSLTLQTTALTSKPRLFPLASCKQAE